MLSSPHKQCYSPFQTGISVAPLHSFNFLAAGGGTASSFCMSLGTETKVGDNSLFLFTCLVVDWFECGKGPNMHATKKKPALRYMCKHVIVIGILELITALHEWSRVRKYVAQLGIDVGKAVSS